MISIQADYALAIGFAGSLSVVLLSAVVSIATER